MMTVRLWWASLLMYNHQNKAMQQKIFGNLEQRAPYRSKKNDLTYAFWSWSRCVKCIRPYD